MLIASHRTPGSGPLYLVFHAYDRVHRRNQLFSGDGSHGIPIEPVFQYHALTTERSFRLLTLLPAVSMSDRIECQVEEFQTTDYLKYVALSYTWGKPDPKVQIGLNGCIFGIPENLHEALRHLRHTRYPTTWWIDAICIDQNNIHERGHQVSQMRDIYKRAANVLAWLGPSDSSSSFFMKAVRDSYWNDANAYKNRLQAEIMLSSVQSFFRRPYWTRVWVIQELLVAKEVNFVCGREHLEWAPFGDFLAFFNNTVEFSGSDEADTIMSSWEFLISERKRCNGKKCLHELLFGTTMAQASDQRDRIYALLGLVKRGRGNDITPDYSRSPCAVYGSAIYAMINDMKDGQGRYKDLEEVESVESEIEEEIMQRCQHDPLGGITKERVDCDGDDCGVGDFCLHFLPNLLH